MTDRDLFGEYNSSKLEDCRRKRDSLQKRFEELNTRINEATDFEQEKKYERRKERTFVEIDQVSQEIQALEQAQRRQIAQQKNQELIEIVSGDDSLQAVIQQAYQTTVVHWPTDVPQRLTKPSDMVRELMRIGSGEAGYSALEEFVAYLIHDVESLELIASLTQWGEQYYPQRNWLDLYADIQQKQTERVRVFQPAILIKLRLDEEKTTQSNSNEPHYRIEAWLIENVETYQQQGKQRTGYHSLSTVGSPLEQPFLLEHLNDENIQPLLDQWLRQTRQLLMGCEEDPQFYVFLPKALLHLEVDYWALDLRNRPSRLGQVYPVVLCCSDRLESIYPVKNWHKFWRKYQICLERSAHEVFIEASDRDIDSLIDDLEELSETLDDETDNDQIDNVIGLKIIHAPCPPRSEELFEELLVSGLPLAIWGRCDEVNITNAAELDTILKASCLGNLHQTIQRKRRESRRQANTSSCHIGHHLSLLQDSPTLIPPKSA